MNSVLLIGRLTKDPTVSHSSGSQTAIAKFSLAISRGKKANGEDAGTDYPSITCFGKTAELAEKYLSKGRQVAVQGRLQTGSYEKDGHRIYTTDVVAERIEFLGSKPEGSESQKTEEPDELSMFSLLKDEDIPF